MRTLKQLCIVVAASLVLGCAFSAPAAISEMQWGTICFNALGLRSATSKVDVGDAGFRLDNGILPQHCGPPPPGNWDTVLKNTIEFIKNYPNSGNNYLLIVRCVGTAERHLGFFPKCNSTQAPIIATTPNRLSTYRVDQLINWVNTNIP